MIIEMDSLMKNDTWTLVPKQQSMNTIGSKWVFKLKRDSNGDVIKHKARLVAQGYSQIHGLDYNEVFSPVTKFPTIRILLVLSNIHDLEVHQMDVKTAFLNGQLDHEIYMDQPVGFEDPTKPDFICKLNKSIYGLKQSARCWNLTITQYLTSDGYIQCAADDCLFTKIKDDKFIILCLYVDDVIPISNSTELLREEKSKLCNKFEMTDNGDIDFILGMFIWRDRANHVLTIDQTRYLENILKRFGMENCKPVGTPMEVGKHFVKAEDNDELFDTKIYQQAIGCLTYASIITRPDISVAVNTNL